MECVTRLGNLEPFGLLFKSRGDNFLWQNNPNDFAIFKKGSTSAIFIVKMAFHFLGDFIFKTNYQNAEVSRPNS